MADCSAACSLLPATSLNQQFKCATAYYAKRQLSDRFRVIVWDLPGLGKSNQPIK